MAYINRREFKSLEDLHEFLIATDLELHVGINDEPITYSKLESGREEYCAAGDKDRWRDYTETVTYGLYLNNSFFPSSDYQSLKEIGFKNFEEFKMRKSNVNKLFEEYLLVQTRYNHLVSQAPEHTKRAIREDTKEQIEGVFIYLPIAIIVAAIICLLFLPIYTIAFAVCSVAICVFVIKVCIELEIEKQSKRKWLKRGLPAEAEACRLELDNKKQKYNQELSEFNSFNK